MSSTALRVGPAKVSGNGVVLEVRREGGEWLVAFMCEPRNSPESLWFHLECTGAGGRRIRFAWLNAHVCLGTESAEAMANVRPVVRLDNGRWQRVRQVEVLKLPLGGHYLEFTTPAACRRAAAAFCYPYGPQDLQATLRHTHGFWAVETIGLTAKGRQLVRLHADAERKRSGRPGAYILARQHSGETPGSWVLDGLLRAVAAEHPPARLRRVEWWAVPFVDLDGVVEGNYGKDTLPIDFNRAWACMAMRPEVHAIQHDMQYFAEGRQRRLVLDLHGPGGGETRVYHLGCRRDRPRAHRRANDSFTPFLEAEISEQGPERAGVVPEYASRWDWNHAVKCWAWDELNETLGVTLETAYQPIQGTGWSTEEDYRQIGGRVARVAAAWLTRPRAK